MTDIDNLIAWRIAYRVLSIALMICNMGLLIWLHARFAALPASSVNVRAILGCIESVRVQLQTMAEKGDMDNETIRRKLKDIAEMIDVYVLRVKR